MSIEQNFEARILKALSEHSGKRIDRFKPDAHMWRDLKLGGDTIVEILESLVEEFDMDFENYSWWENYPTEGELLSPIWFVKSLFDKHRKFDDLTVEQFVALMQQYLPKDSKPA